VALIKTLLNKTPIFGKNCWLAETATVIGDVEMGDQCTIWYNAVLRGDVNSIKLGNKVNIQDNAMVHCTYKKTGTILGDEVSVGHNAIVHGCTIENNVLIGMGAIVMDLAHIGQGSIIAAGAVVKENEIVPPFTLWAGVPAKQVKVLDPKMSIDKLNRLANNYVMYAKWYQDEK
jgi:carbonic anhydrase/acetyltransferase-like protein (isoleucine patch superfamily)